MLTSSSCSVDGTFVPWTVTLRQRLLDESPLPDGVEPIAEDVLIEPKWILDFADPQSDSIPSQQILSDSKQDDIPSEGLIPVPKAIAATISSNERITTPEHHQDTRHTVLTLPEQHDYPPGATLTLYPKNFPSDVDTFLELMSWQDVADKPIQFVPTVSDAELSRYPPAPVPGLTGHTLTLRTLLTEHLDIMAIPRRSFFAHLAYFTDNEMYLERLHEFTSPELIDELYDYTTRPRRSILEALSDFPGVKIPWQKVCTVVPRMRGRQFSIASGGDLKSFASLTSIPTSLPQTATDAAQNTSSSSTTAQDGPASTRIDLLIAIVKYRTIIKRIRHGVATRYISTLRPGQRISVTLQPGSLGIKRSDLHRPVVMIGPGTGVAPMRALAYERALWRQEEHDGEQEGAISNGADERSWTQDLLFFGCRKKGVDEYFAHEWPQLDVDVHTAYSRDQVCPTPPPFASHLLASTHTDPPFPQLTKVYVQDLIRSSSRLVYAHLAERAGLVFVCGSSGKMPQAVRQALVDVFVKEGGMDIETAEGYLKGMEKQGRYLQETW